MQTPGEAEAGKDQIRQKLAVLLDVSIELGKARDTDSMLNKVVEKAYETLTVDRVAIQLLDEASGTLITKIARDKRGGDQPRAVPQSSSRTMSSWATSTRRRVR